MLPAIPKSVLRAALLTLGIGTLLSLAGVLFRVREAPRHPSAAEAIPLAKQVLVEAEEAFGADDLATAEPMKQLALLLYDAGRYTEAESLFRKALQIRESQLPADSPGVLDAVETLALFYHDTGEAGLAAPLLERAIKDDDDLPDPSKTAGAPPVAGPGPDIEPVLVKVMLPDRLLRSRLTDLRVRPSNHPAEELTGQAWLRIAGKDLPAAGQLFRRALAMRENSPDQDPMAIAGLLTGLALTEPFQEAEESLVRAIYLCNTFGTGEEADLRMAAALHGLALLYFDAGLFAEAGTLFSRAAGSRRQRLGRDHPDYQTVVHNLGFHLETTGDPRKARASYREAVSIAERGGNLAYPLVNPLVSHLVQMEVLLGDPAGARALVAEVLAARETGDAVGLAPLQEWIETVGTETAGHTEAGVTSVPGLAGGSRSVDLNSAADCDAMAVREFQAGREAESLSLAIRSVDLREKYDRHLNSRSEKVAPGMNDISVSDDRVSREQSFSLPCSLGDPGLIARTLLHGKIAAYDAVYEDREIARLGGAALSEALRAAQRKCRYFDLNEPAAATPENENSWRLRRDTARADLKWAERRLAEFSDLKRQGENHVLQATVEEIQAKMNAGQVIVEFARYERIPQTGESESRYGALVIAATGEPVWIPLDPSADLLDREIGLHQKAAKALISDSEMRQHLESLYQHLWTPVERAFPAGTEAVLISPDGQLNFVSFATLLAPDGTFLARKYLINYVSSGRDLLAAASPPANQNLCLMAAPRFDLALPLAASGGLREPVEPRDGERLAPWSPLPGTLIEAEGLVRSAAGWLSPPSITLMQDAGATEAALKRIGNPRILHLATHGFFWDQPAGPGRSTRTGARDAFIPVPSDPLFRSGIALAGANTTLALWRQGRVPPAENDGILLAAEVAELNLEGTWLVVLSACQTGMGESRGGEGVLGLRSAFLKAGARNLLLTLWGVDDLYTAGLMEKFYARIARGGDPGNALAVVQREELVALRARQGLAAAVQLAGPFVMNGVSR